MATTKETEVLTTLIVDAQTGVIEERPLNPEELQQRQLDVASEAERIAQQEAKATARASALAKLAELGLTEEEVAAL